MPDPGHAAHDPLLIAAHAAGDATGADLDHAAALVASCAECARLHRDLRALAAALGSVPAPARPRDFRLTAADAAVLRRPAGWRRILAPLSGARSSAGALSASLAALGLAGLLLSAGPIPPLGAGSASAPQPAASQAAASAAAMGNFSFDSNAPERAVGGLSASAAASMAAASAPAASAQPAASASTGAPNADATAAPSAPPVATDKSTTQGSAVGTAVPALPPASGQAVLGPETATAGAMSGSQSYAAGSGQAAGPSPLVIGSVVVLAAGVLLGILRLAARRLV